MDCILLKLYFHDLKKSAVTYVLYSPSEAFALKATEENNKPKTGTHCIVGQVQWMALKHTVLCKHACTTF